MQSQSRRKDHVSAPQPFETQLDMVPETMRAPVSEKLTEPPGIPFEQTVSQPKAPSAVHRVVTTGQPQFQLRQGEQGLSVFDASRVTPEDVQPHFREGSETVTKRIDEIESHGLMVISTPGNPSLPQHLQDAHMEIRPGPDMTRNQFKQAIKKLERNE